MVGQVAVRLDVLRAELVVDAQRLPTPYSPPERSVPKLSVVRWPVGLAAKGSQSGLIVGAAFYLLRAAAVPHWRHVRLQNGRVRTSDLTSDLGGVAFLVSPP